MTLPDARPSPRPWLPWNWKTALWSGCYRAPAFLIGSWRFGLGEAFTAAGAEFTLFAALAGFTGAATQGIRHLRPIWVRAAIIALVIPVFLHSSEWLVHGWLRTPSRSHSVAISIAMTVIAEVFNLYAMRHGALLSGDEGGSFTQDMRRMPSIVFGFVTYPFRAAGALLRKLR
jgi:4-amino-4-deoxy-L-arabinose transferase-like glycosyltransferase